MPPASGESPSRHSSQLATRWRLADEKPKSIALHSAPAAPAPNVSQTQSQETRRVHFPGASRASTVPPKSQNRLLVNRTNQGRRNEPSISAKRRLFSAGFRVGRIKRPGKGMTRELSW